MNFTSYAYLLFLFVAVILVRVTRGLLREYVLLAASVLFYATWDARYLLVLVGLGAFTYWAGHRIEKGRSTLSALSLPVLVIVLVLSAFKYTGMLVELVNLALPSSSRMRVPSIILPLGISFYTFECISYLIDRYKGGQEIVPFRRFLLFPAFWPHMVAGPILRVKEFAPQLDALRPATAEQILAGIDRILIGLLKKLILANTLASFVDQGFAQGATANSSVDNWALAFAFGLQIYFDFSSYTDIAIGSAQCVGFTFPENFNLPYHAPTPTEFWNRWHMTLSRWIRDYVFFPLNLKAGARIWLRYVSLVGVMALVGLWHGAGLGFILWGLWHGVLLVGHRMVQTRSKRLPDGVKPLLGWAGHAVTLVLVVAGWVLFRSHSIAQSGRMLASMFSLRGLKPSYSVNDYLFVALAIFEYVAFEPWFKRFVDRDPRAIDHQRWTFWCRPLAYGIAVELIFMFDGSNVGFIYFQF